MTLSLLVSNQSPDIDDNVPRPLINLFHAYTKGNDGQVYPLFEHQAQTFRTVEQDRPVFLVAGTAAGKTLAMAIPLFEKLRTGRVRKVLFMYPTIALMEDQRKVMDSLAQIIDVGVGLIQGGMSRSKLMEAVNKPVILSTPDAIYWFFRKNVKYSGLLMYTLALVDEFILDEAHLFNGLMLYNFEHLWKRVQSLAALLGKSPRLHVLTATPIEALQTLNGATPIFGRSRCQAVAVKAEPRGPFDRRDAISKAISEALATGQRKVLVVCNSARAAHQLFEMHRVKDTTLIPVEHRLRFGQSKLGVLISFLEETGVEQVILDSISASASHKGDVPLSELPRGARVELPLQEVVAAVTDVLEGQCWHVKRALWERTQRPGETWETLLHNRALPCRILKSMHRSLVSTSDLQQQRTAVDRWLADTLEKLVSLEVADEKILCESPDYLALHRVLAAALGEELADLLVARISRDMRAEYQWLSLPSRTLTQQPVYLSWLGSIVGPEHAVRIQNIVKRGLESGELAAECRHIGLWKGTRVPVIVYTGSMAKHSRAGLIDVFADLEQAVLISTSAVEVGVDFRADALITEECEGNSFLQRFGRVGRHGDASEAIVFVGGDVYAQLRSLDGKTVTREAFSEQITRAFPQRSYATASRLADAGHYLINQQLGRIGQRLNARPDVAAVQRLAEQLRAADISVGFGLRSTLPQIALRDGVTKDPLYLLRYLGNRDLRPSDSPFEVARAQTWFTELIFQRARFSVFTDINETLKASRCWFRRVSGVIEIGSVQNGIGATYRNGMNTYFAQHEEWHCWLPGNFVLMYGDIYLQRCDLEVSRAEPITDIDQNPLFIPNQVYMVFLGWNDMERAQNLVAGSPIANWQELYYDWDGVQRNEALVVLERTAGACFAAYEEWMEYASRQVKE